MDGSKFSAAVEQERVIVEPSPDGRLLVLYPDGEVAGYANHRAAERAIRGRARRAVPKTGVLVTEIEWRDGA